MGKITISFLRYFIFFIVIFSSISYAKELGIIHATATIGGLSGIESELELNPIEVSGLGVLPGCGFILGTRGLPSGSKQYLGICGHIMMSDSLEDRSSFKYGISGEVSSGGYSEIFAGINFSSKYINSQKISNPLWLIVPDDYGVKVCFSNGSTNYYRIGVDINFCVGYAFFIKP